MEKESDKMEVEDETAGTPATDGDAKDKEGSDAQKDDTEEKTPGWLSAYIILRTPV